VGAQAPNIGRLYCEGRNGSGGRGSVPDNIARSHKGRMGGGILLASPAGAPFGKGARKSPKGDQEHPREASRRAKQHP